MPSKPRASRAPNKRQSYSNMLRSKAHLLLLSALVAALTCSFTTPFSTNYKADLNLIVLDAGHGGRDPGAVSGGIYEKTIVLNIVNKVKAMLEANKATHGIQVKLTRSDDTFIGLSRRAQIANEAKADVFISIHANANRSSQPYGTETYALGMHKSDANLDVVMKENGAILLEEDHEETYQGFDPNSEEAYIVFSLVQNAHLKESLRLAQNIEENFKAQAKRYSRGVKQAGFLVLWRTSMPAVLIETGFITNSTERQFLASDQGQTYLAKAIYQAILDYKGVSR